MVTMLPPAELSMLSGLVDLLRNPDKLQAHLDELSEAQRAFAETRDLAQKDLAEAQRLHAAIEYGQAELAKREKEFTAQRTQWDADRTATSAEIHRIQENLRLQSEEIARAASKLVNDQADLALRVKDVEGREQLVVKLDEVNKNRQAELEQRMLRIKEAAA